MILDEFLSEYYKKVYIKRKRKVKEFTTTEKITITMMVFFAIVYAIGVVIFQEDISIIMFLSIAVFSLLVLLLCFCQYSYNEGKLARIEKYKLEILPELEKLLNHYNMNEPEKIDKIISWCETKKIDDSVWIEMIRPFGAFVVIIFIPASIAVLSELLSGKSIVMIVQITVIYVLICFMVFIIWWAVAPEITYFLNKKQNRADRLAEDLKNLYFK